jgi:hypothetical protein
VKEENIFETSVPGSYELPLAARFLALSGTVDAIVCAGVLIKGEVSRNIDSSRICTRRRRGSIGRSIGGEYDSIIDLFPFPLTNST